MRLLHPPPTAMRVIVGLIGIATIASNAAILLSDRAPGILRALFGDATRRITERLDAAGRSDATTTARQLGATVGDTVGGDSIVHFGLWATATIVVGLAIWSWRGLIISSGAIAVASLVVEVGQGRYSSTRAVERSDAWWNLLGVSAGAVIVGVTYLFGEAVGRTWSRFGRSKDLESTSRSV